MQKRLVIMMLVLGTGFLGRGAGLSRAEAGKPCLAPTPPMGWNAWNCFGPNVDEERILGNAQAMVERGMKDAGYQYIVIDDGWEKGRVDHCWGLPREGAVAGRDENGRLLVDETKFPHGLKFVSGYIHDNGLKFGIYTGPGAHTCQCLTASGGFEAQDIATFVSWGVDFIKLDWCGHHGPAEETMALWRRLLNDCGRPIVLSVNAGPVFDVCRKYADMWRTTWDIRHAWDYRPGEFHWESSVTDIIDMQLGLGDYHGHCGWNDPDMLILGSEHFTESENRCHFGMWCMFSAPLMAGHDLRSMSESTCRIITHREVIAIDQDPAGIWPARMPDHKPGMEIWAKPLYAYATIAVALLNRTDQEAPMTVPLADLGISGEVFVRDLWKHQDLGLHQKTFTARVPARDMVMVKLQAFEHLRPMEKRFDTIPAEGKIYQVEDSQNVYAGGVFDTAYANFTGTLYAKGQVDGNEHFNHSMIWIIESDRAGTFLFEIRYSNASGKTVNYGIGVHHGGGKELYFPSGADWNEWRMMPAELRLEKGFNRVHLCARGIQNNVLAVDYLKITPIKE